MYELNEEEYIHTGYLDDDYLWLNASEAKTKADKGLIRRIGNGTAVTGPYYETDYVFYRMLTYEASFWE